MNADTVIQAFHDARPIRNTQVDGQLVIAPDLFNGQITCFECHFPYFQAACAQLNEPVRFANCHFDYLDFYATYFVKGLNMDGCVISDRVTFQSGGHNDKGCPFAIANTRFDSFADFEDCWFTGPFRLENVVFSQGTNLLGNLNNPMAVSFDFEPEIINVDGDVNIDTYKPLN